MEGSVDSIINTIGLGRWQALGVLQASIFQLGQGSLVISGALLNPHVGYRCLSESPSNALQYNNQFSDDESTIGVSAHNKSDLVIGGCLPSNYSYNHELDPDYPASCQHIIYDTSIFASTFTTEFNLVCDRMPIRALFQSLFFFGGMLGSFLSGLLSDRYGRRTVVRIGSILAIAIAFANLYSPKYWQVLVLRFFAGIVQYMTYLSGYCLAIELTPKKQRSTIGLLPGIFFGLNVAAFAGMGYWWLRDWRYLQFASCAPVMLMLPVIILIDESPRWLVQQGRFAEAEAILIKGAQLNKAKISSDKISLAINAVQNIPSKILKEVTVKKASLFEGLASIIKSPIMRRITICMFILRVLIACVYYGIAFNASNFTKNNAYLYIALTGLIEIPVLFLAAPIASYCKRRTTMCVCFIATGTLLLVDLLIPHEYSLIRWTCVMGSFAISCITFHMVYVYCPELFPTEVRGQGLSFATVMGSFGSLLAPIITDLMGSLVWWGVGFTLGLTSLISALLIWLIPETKGQPLFNTIAEFENYKNIQKSMVAKSKEINCSNNDVV